MNNYLYQQNLFPSDFESKVLEVIIIAYLSKCSGLPKLHLFECSCALCFVL